MSDLPQQSTLKQYYGDGSTDTFIYNFLILSATSLVNDIAVYLTPPGQEANPTTDILVLNVDYTVTGVGNVNGGTVIITPAPANNSVVTITRNMSISIDTQFADARNFNGQNLDDAFERVVLIMQQINTQFTYHALQYFINSFLPTVTSNYLPILTTADNQVWISQGGQIVAAQFVPDDMSTLRSQLAISNSLADGAMLVGYYDKISAEADTVHSFLNNVQLKTNAHDTNGGADLIGYYDVLNGVETTVGAYLNSISTISEFTTLSYGTPGTFTFNVPLGVTKIYITGCAAGGGGGGSGAADGGGTYVSAGSAGGDAGQSTFMQSLTVTPSETVTVVIGTKGFGGAGGVAGPNNGVAGTAGGNTTISGTFGTITLTGGVGGTASAAGITSSVSGTPSSGTSGESGGASINVAGLSLTGQGGMGGSGPFGSPGHGGYAEHGPAGGTNGANASGRGCGGGGAGGAITEGGAALAGGAGGNGSDGFMAVQY